MRQRKGICPLVERGCFANGQKCQARPRRLALIIPSCALMDRPYNGDDDDAWVCSRPGSGLDGGGCGAGFLDAGQSANDRRGRHGAARRYRDPRHFVRWSEGRADWGAAGVAGERHASGGYVVRSLVRSRGAEFEPSGVSAGCGEPCAQGADVAAGGDDVVRPGVVRESRADGRLRRRPILA